MKSLLVIGFWPLDMPYPISSRVAYICTIHQFPNLLDAWE